MSGRTHKHCWIDIHQLVLGFNVNNSVLIALGCLHKMSLASSKKVYFIFINPRKEQIKQGYVIIKQNLIFFNKYYQQLMLISYRY